MVERVRLILRARKSDLYLYPLFSRINKETEGQWAGWEFIKGGVNPGENSIDAVFREFEEETGLNYRAIEKTVIKLNTPYNLIVRRGKDKGKIEFIDSYFAEMPFVDTSLYKLDKEEHDKVSYFDRLDVIMNLSKNLKNNIFMDLMAFKQFLNYEHNYMYDSLINSLIAEDISSKLF